MTTIHDLRHLSMGRAYDETQVNDSIKHGDVLLVRDGVAVLIEAWPTMVSGKSEVFHGLNKPWEEAFPDDARLLAGVALARSIEP